MCSLLRSVDGSSLSFFSSPNSPCSSPRVSSSVFADYLRFHYSAPQLKAWHCRARGYLSEFLRATYPEEFHSLSAPLSPQPNFLRLSQVFPVHCHWPRQSCLFHAKALPRVGIKFLLHISWSLHSFPSLWKISFIPIHKMWNPLDSPFAFQPISLISCISKFFECIVLSRLLFFLEYSFILSPYLAGFRPGQSTLNQVLFLSQSICYGFNKSTLGFRTILPTIDLFKALILLAIPLLFTNLLLSGLLLFSGSPPS